MKRICFAILAIFLLAAAPWAAEVEVLKPRGNLEIKLGHPSTISFYDMPAVMTQERLNSHGWNIKSVEFTRTDLNVQAIAQGTVQIANSQVMDPVRANQIDVTLLQLGDWFNLDSQAPGRYHIIRTGSLLNISGSIFWANAEWLRKNEEVATAYFAELLKTFRMVHANPKIMEPVVAKYL